MRHVMMTMAALLLGLAGEMNAQQAERATLNMPLIQTKVEIEPFEKCCKDISNIVFLTKRYWVQWGGVFAGALSNGTV